MPSALLPMGKGAKATAEHAMIAVVTLIIILYLYIFIQNYSSSENYIIMPSLGMATADSNLPDISNNELKNQNSADDLPLGITIQDQPKITGNAMASGAQKGLCVSGDCDGNEIITCDDYLCAQAYVRGPSIASLCPTTKSCCDMNSDSVIDISDVDAILQLATINGRDCTPCALGDIDKDQKITCEDVSCIFAIANGENPSSCMAGIACADIAPLNSPHSSDGKIDKLDYQLILKRSKLLGKSCV